MSTTKQTFAERACICENACSGMENPHAEISRLRECEKENAKLNETMREVYELLKGERLHNTGVGQEVKECIARAALNQK